VVVAADIALVKLVEIISYENDKTPRINLMKKGNENITIRPSYNFQSQHAVLTRDGLINTMNEIQPTNKFTKSFLRHTIDDGGSV